jgi:thiamine kinase-like enzyme
MTTTITNRKSIEDCLTLKRNSSASLDTAESDSNIKFQSPTDKLWTNITSHTNIDMEDTEAYKKLCSEILPGWKGIDTSKIEIKNISGHGGSKTYKISCKYASPAAVVLHGRRRNEEDKFTEARMEDAHRSLWEAGVAPPRLYTGDYWYVEPYVSDIRGTKLDKWLREKFPRYQARRNRKAIKMLADLHKNASTAWFEPHREKVIEEFPILKDAKLGSHIWLYTTRLEWYSWVPAEMKQFWQEAGPEPITDAAKRIVVNHGDLHGGNILVDKKECNIWAIDYEFTQPSWAINDIAYCLAIQQFGSKHDSYDGKFTFCKSYLQEMGYPTSKKDVDAFMFDAECQSLRVFHPALLFREMQDLKATPEYKLDKYKAYAKFELAARDDHFLYQEVLEKGIMAAAEEHSEDCKLQKALEIERQKETAPKRREEQIPHQIERKRKRMTYEEELAMEKEAFEGGIVRIEIDEYAIWERAREIAEELAGGLATQEELKASGVNAGKDNDFWNYTIREVQEGEGAKHNMDVVQLGNHTSNPERYISHMKQFGPCSWVNNWQHVYEWKVLNYFYAKRCPVKNQQFKPTTHEKDIKLWVDFITEKEKKKAEGQEKRVGKEE